MDERTIKEALDRAKGLTVAVLGDLYLDEYQDGVVDHISEEGPFPVFTATDEPRLSLGAAGNVARQVRALGASCHLIAVRGEDDAGIEALDLLKEADIIPTVRRDISRPTTHKLKYLAKGRHVWRVDRESKAPIIGDVEQEILDLIKAHSQNGTTMICADYGNGVFSPKVMTTIDYYDGKIWASTRRDRHRWLAVDAYVLAGNTREWYEWSVPKGNSEDTPWTVDDMLYRAMDYANETAMVCTMGNHGVRWVSLDRGDGTPWGGIIPGHTVREIDPTGAGDALMAVAATLHAAGLSLPEALEAGNMAGAIAVTHPGVEPVTPEELLAFAAQTFETHPKPWLKPNS